MLIGVSGVNGQNVTIFLVEIQLHLEQDGEFAIKVDVMLPLWHTL